MRILAIDIGAGTQDILLYDSKIAHIENSIKLILPSPSRILAKKVEKATTQKRDLFVKGETIGGGKFTQAIKKHLKEGLKVYMTPLAAASIRNKLSEVEQLGIKIVDESFEKKFDGTILKIGEVNLDLISTVLTSIEENINKVDVVAVAVQDHGLAPEGTSDRMFRIAEIKKLFEQTPYPWALAFKDKEIPEFFLRMQSAKREIKSQLPSAKILIMDTSAAAIFGALQDDKINSAKTIIASDIGNSHTMMALIKEGRIIALLEHHTHMLNKNKIRDLFVKLAEGSITNEDVFNDGGHGVFYLDAPPGIDEVERIVVTGPNRSIVENLNLPIHFAAPAGDVMITGPIGLIAAIKEKFR